MKHVLITGTGRCGTTFLVELLTHLGFDTGFSVDNLERYKFSKARAGLEIGIHHIGSPRIRKRPLTAQGIDVFIRSGRAEKIIMPIRILEHAVQSRVNQQGAIKNQFVPGGLEGTLDPSKQGEVYLWLVYNMLYHASLQQVPVFLMQFPKIVKDAQYLYDCLEAVFGVEMPTFPVFEQIFNEVAKPELITVK